MDLVGAPISSDIANCPKAQSAFRVIIPAHNEEAVIARCLSAALGFNDPSHQMEVVVVVNGSTDRTAEIARTFGKSVRVVETSTASKAQAINLGLEGAQNCPCLVVDADVVCTYESLQATANALADPAVSAASPRLVIDLNRASWVVRAYYKVWRALPYATERLVGGGVYGLSADTIARLTPIPDIVADDLYVRGHVPLDARRCVAHGKDGASVCVTMYPPRTARDLISIEARRWMGTRELRRKLPASAAMARNGSRSWLTNLGSHYGFCDLLTYATVKLSGRCLAFAQGILGHSSWNRDTSSRDVR